MNHSRHPAVPARHAQQRAARRDDAQCIWPDHPRAAAPGVGDDFQHVLVGHALGMQRDQADAGAGRLSRRAARKAGRAKMAEALSAGWKARASSTVS
jgi:hypothetical protein